MLPLVIAVTAVALALLLVAEWRDDARLRWAAKPIASAAFVALAVTSGATSSGYGRALLAALVLSFAGDVLLIPRVEAAFRAGVLAFGLGHLAFVVAFIVHGVRPALVALALLPLCVVAAFVRHRLRPHVPDGLRLAVDGYMVVITAMLSCAVGTQHTQIIAGALAFYLSDLSVARDRFLQPGFANRVWGLPLYYAAQLTLAATLVRVT